MKILFVDDHEDTREVISQLLTVSGHTVETTGTVFDAMASIRQQHFDLLICDLSLPDGTGHDLMKSIPAEKPIKGILLSGYGSAEDIAHSLAVGYRVHLIKPVDYNQLMAAIDQVTKSGA